MSKVEQIEIELETAVRDIAEMKALARLKKNPDFITVITEGYFQKEAARIVALKADPNFIMAGKLQMKVLDTLEAGVGALQAHFRLINTKGDIAQGAMDDMEDTRTQIMAEEMIEGELVQ